jgi:hypothetical protein
LKAEKLETTDVTKTDENTTDATGKSAGSLVFVMKESLTLKLQSDSTRGKAQGILNPRRPKGSHLIIELALGWMSVQEMRKHS